MVDWIVFGDDWGVHPSTTQHLILNLPTEDSVVWLDSIGMRQPRLRAEDIRRIWQKAKGFARASTQADALYPGTLRRFARIKPKILPWHLNSAARRFNASYLRRAIGEQVGRLGMSGPILVATDPVVIRYADAIAHSKLVYLRLDDYAHYPGVDPELVIENEREMFERADMIFATAKALLPGAPFSQKSHYLPQGVQVEHFAAVPLQPPRTKVLGFFGTISEWLDFGMIERVALAAPDWELRFVGKVEFLPDSVARLSNTRFFPPVPFTSLPEIMADWTVAWIPFVLNELTEAVNPLKAREYLAAGLPSHCTPLPEIEVLSEQILVTSEAEEVVQWMNETLSRDTIDARSIRRKSVRPDSWAERAAAMRHIILSEPID